TRPRRDRHRRAADAVRHRPPPLGRRRPRSPARRAARPARVGADRELDPRARIVRSGGQQRLQPGSVNGMDWNTHAVRLAEQVTSPRSRWRPVVGGVPRHVFVPRWWQRIDYAPGPYGTAVWSPAAGPADPEAWTQTAYADRSLVTQVGTEHADNADRAVTGAPTSSATLPSLLVAMFRHA